MIELNIPRDRNGNFEPAIVKKKQSRIAGLDQKIVSLYAKGMSLSDIKLQLQELYDADVRGCPRSYYPGSNLCIIRLIIDIFTQASLLNVVRS